MRRLAVAVSVFLFLVSVFGCADGRFANGVKSQPALLKGVFWDSPVGGLNYTTPTISGVTKADGVFEYRPGEDLTFSIGNFVLGSTPGKPFITPLDLVSGAKDASDQRVVNICVMLQTLDTDGDPENGILISEQVASVVTKHGKDICLNAPAHTFSFDRGFRNVMAELNQIDAFGTEPRGVTPPVRAGKHLEASLKKIREMKQME